MKFLLALMLLSSPLSFPELSNDIDGKEVQVRGFLYRGTDQEWVLAPEPNIKSCCLTSKPKILLFGELTETTAPVTIQGIFSANPMAIHNAKIVSQESVWPLKSLALIGFCILGFFLTRRQK